MSAAGIDSRRAWGVVAAAFAAMFAAFGIAYSYGAFLAELRADFGAGRALGAVFFSLTSLVYFGLGSLSGGPAQVDQGSAVDPVAAGTGLARHQRAGNDVRHVILVGKGHQVDMVEGIDMQPDEPGAVILMRFLGGDPPHGAVASELREAGHRTLRSAMKARTAGPMSARSSASATLAVTKPTLSPQS